VTDEPKKPRKQRAIGDNKTVPGMEYARRRRAGEPPKQWNPEYAARIPWYPKSPEAFARWQQNGRDRMARLKAEGRFPTRRGVPDGWGGRKHIAQELRAKAQAEAKEIVAFMVKNKMVESEDPRAEEALEAMIAIVRAKDEAMATPLYPPRDRIAAANTVLAYTKQKPATKTDLNVRRAEDFLEAVAEDMKTSE
jgi:hypothetical protein